MKWFSQRLLIVVVAPMVLLNHLVMAQDNSMTTLKISNKFKYESSMWSQRNLKGNATLDLEAFDEVLTDISNLLCDLGITATIFDGESNQVYQKTVGNVYYGFNGYLNHSDRQPTGWTGDTPMAIYSNAKILGVLTFMASVVDQGLGYLDEPIYRIFPDLISANSTTGMATPRMLMSHSSGLAKYDRNNPDSDPYYSCIYNETTTLEDCLSDHLFNDDTLRAIPGTIASYANEPFDILAAIVVRKTNASSYAHAMEQYLTEPLGMNDTTIECDVTQSTGDKPHIAWGVCSTANDMAKLVQLLGNNGVGPDGTALVSPFSMQQIFSQGTGVAGDADGTLLSSSSFPFSRCYSTLKDRYRDVPHSISGYGLGTMFMPGTKGQWFTHAGSKGGYWAVAPKRFSVYLGWQHEDANPAYVTIASAVEKLDQSSSFYVSKMEQDEWEEIETCGGGIYLDWLTFLNYDSIQDITAYDSCETSRHRQLKQTIRNGVLDVDWMAGMEEIMKQL